MTLWSSELNGWDLKDESYVYETNKKMETDLIYKGLRKGSEEK